MFCVLNSSGGVVGFSHVKIHVGIWELEGEKCKIKRGGNGIREEYGSSLISFLLWFGCLNWGSY